MSKLGKRLVRGAAEARDVVRFTQPGFETPAEMRTVDAIARAICSSNCAYRGVSPCWSIWTNRPDAMEWPNPHCEEPGCWSIATDVYASIVPGRRKK